MPDAVTLGATMPGWTPEQWVTMISGVIFSLTTAIISYMNNREHRVQRKLLVQAETKADQVVAKVDENTAKVDENTAKTEQTVIQLQNNNRAVAKAEEKLENHTTELQNLVFSLQADKEELVTRLTQAASVLADVKAMNVVLKTAERQQQFEHDLADLAQLIQQYHPESLPRRDPVC